MKESLSEKEITNLLEESKVKLEKYHNSYKLYYDKDQIYSSEFDNFKSKFYECVKEQINVIKDIADEKKGKIKAGFHSPICRVAKFLEEIIKIYEDSNLQKINLQEINLDEIKVKLSEIKLKGHQTIYTLKDIIKRWKNEI